MDIEYIKRFVVVSQCLNFSKAADKLFISQPTLSYSIANIEKKLGAPLFMRSTQSVKLTRAGEIFLPAAIQIVDLYQKVIHEISQAHQSDSNTLCIGYTGPTMDNILSSWIETFRSIYPDTKVHVLHYGSPVIAEAFENHSIHLGILYKMNANSIPGLKYQEVGSEKFRVLLHAGHPLANQSSIDLASLKDEPFLICERASSPNYYDHVLAICERRGLHPKIFQTAALVGDIYRLVSMGLGIAIMSYSAARSYDAYHVKFADIDGDGEDLKNTVVLAWLDKISPLARQFRNIAKKDVLS